MTPYAVPPGAERVDVLALVDRAATADGVAPLSESFRLALVGGERSAAHVLTRDDDGRLTAYGQRQQDGSAELVTDPVARRRGFGSQTLAGLLALGPTTLWAHGNLPPAQGFTARHGLDPVRELHLMSRPLTREDASPPTLPEGFVARPFEPGRDDDAWLAVNAAAFAWHPEQGRVTAADLRTKRAQPWFDAAGFLLVEDVTGERPRLAAFHWTKVDPARVSTTDPARPAGEVYVVGVHPAYQGRGLGGSLTRLGLAHLAARGLPEVVLYVEGDNEPALATYRRLGFTDIAVDVAYRRVEG